MFIIKHQVKGESPITIISLQGDFDASNFQQIIDKGKEIYDSGTRCLLFDMSDIRFMSSAGLVALHSIALIFQGKQPSDPEYGWEAIHSIDRDQESRTQKHVKLINPQPRVIHTLEISGMKEFFEIFDDENTAIASF